MKHKKSEIVSTKKNFPLSSFKSKLRDSELDFKSAISKSGLNIIAEIKKASPSQGIIRRDFDYVDIARVYAECNVSAISVLTEKKYFQGDISFLREIKIAVKNIPLLRKDFIIDDYQIYESRYYDANAILLIAGLLDRKEIRRFISIAKEYSMGCLVEVHNAEELENAIESDAEIIG
ncbi:MAG: indole-3-glycerol phosphate synthase TrpC, partial [Nanoarchaeota archaeon]